MPARRDCLTKANPAELRSTRAVPQIPRRLEGNRNSEARKGQPTRNAQKPGFAAGWSDRRSLKRRSIPAPCQIRGTGGACEKALCQSRLQYRVLRVAHTPALLAGFPRAPLSLPGIPIEEDANRRGAGGT